MEYITVTEQACEGSEINCDIGETKIQSRWIQNECGLIICTHTLNVLIACVCMFRAETIGSVELPCAYFILYVK